MPIVTAADRRWILPRDIPRDFVENLSQTLHLSKTTTSILVLRGYLDLQHIERYLSPAIAHFHDPYTLLGMREACQRIVQAQERKQRIVIFGDYDVDGVTSTALLMKLFEKMSIDADYYIPNRLTEGYGLNHAGIDTARQKGASLLIAVDCGITSVDEVAYARSQNLDVIVIDHHLPEKNIPQDCIIINPKQERCLYPCKDLSGVGLAFKLAQALLEDPLTFVDLAAFGTVADIVPLRDENRVIVFYGLEALTQTANIGLQKLKQVSGLFGKAIVPHHIGFVLGPRVNAAGRLGLSDLGVNLLLSTSVDDALMIAEKLDEENLNRRSIEQQVLLEAVHMVKMDMVESPARVIVLYKPHWHIGVIGIVASKLVAKFQRPVILLCGEGPRIRGSGRSIESFHLYNAIFACRDHLEEFGGHSHAAGVALHRHQFESFCDAMKQYCDRHLKDDDLILTIRVDAHIGVDDISFKLVNEVEKLAPFGAENPRPTFYSHKVRIKSEPTLLKKEHIKFWVQWSSDVLEIIAFNMGHRYKELCALKHIDIVYTLGINDWKGHHSIQLQLKDFRPSHSL